MPQPAYYVRRAAPANRMSMEVTYCSFLALLISFKAVLFKVQDPFSCNKWICNVFQAKILFVLSTLPQSGVTDEFVLCYTRFNESGIIGDGPS